MNEDVYFITFRLFFKLDTSYLVDFLIVYAFNSASNAELLSRGDRQT